MKTYAFIARISLGVIALGVLPSQRSLFAGESRDSAAEPTARKSVQRIGVFDSRAVAYAYFWSDAHQRELTQRAAAAKAAKAAGDEATFQKLSHEIQEAQKTVHLQVFSTAPVDEILAGMADHVSALKRELGFTWLVSKWDREALDRLSDAERIDVTEKLVAYFPLPEKRARGLPELLKHEPLALPAARALADKDQL